VSNDDNIQTAIDAGRQLAGAGPRVLAVADPNHPGRQVLVGLVSDSHGETIRVLGDAMDALGKLAPGPQRRAGVSRLTDEDSFIGFVQRWGGEGSVIYADTAGLGFTAVLDDHPEGPHATAWREHRGVYACPRSPAWIEWTRIDGKPLTQPQLADFIEARLEDLVAAEKMPTPLDVLGVTRAITLKTKATYQREIAPNGDRIVVCKTETDTGSTVIPRAFAIAIPVFEAGVRYQVEVRVRVEIVEGVPVFTLVMHRRKEIELDAFREVRAKIAAETGRPILAGVA
jgi:uncharacterized protein YfdQ (DUF2303 family)